MIGSSDPSKVLIKDAKLCAKTTDARDCEKGGRLSCMTTIESKISLTLLQPLRAIIPATREIEGASSGPESGQHEALFAATPVLAR